MNRELATRLFDSSVRIAGMWPIHGLTDALPSYFEDAVEDRPLPPEVAAMIHGYDPEEELSGDDFAEAMGDAYCDGKFGFIVLADCPVYTATSNESASSSWGHWRSKLIYGESAEAALIAACEWAEGQFHSALAAFKEKAQANA